MHSGSCLKYLFLTKDIVSQQMFSRRLNNGIRYSWRSIFTTHVPCKYKKGRPAALPKKHPATDKALEHFDEFYKNVYGLRWPSIRLALLSPHKYCALVNNFGDSEETVKYLQNQGALSLRRLYEVGKSNLKEVEDSKSENGDMEKIYKLDQQIEMAMYSKQMEEFHSIYQAEDTIPRQLDLGIENETTGGRKATAAATSIPEDIMPLKHSIDNAEIDENRLVDPNIGLSSATLYEFIPATKLKGMEDWVLESQHYEFYKRNSDFPVIIKKEYDLNFPEHLEMFIFERGNVSPFPSPRSCTTGVLNYYLMDGGSVLPVLALGLEPGDFVLDMCAAPGGKSLVMLQTLYPGHLVCNDVQASRTKRIYSVLRQYLYDLDKWSNQLVVTRSDGRSVQEENVYHKILVDVPCTADRLSLHEDDNNIFNQSRIKERLKLPELQAQLLSSALKMVQPGGTVVYSTCSLSPIQNDGVVHMALRTIWEETNIQLEVRDLSPALDPLNTIFKFGQDIGLRYGHIVLPFLPCNFGPMYFCKIVRTS